MTGCQRIDCTHQHGHFSPSHHNQQGSRGKRDTGNQTVQKPLIIIKHPKSGLVFDASDLEVKLQNYTAGATPQLWRLESNGVGKFFIVNKGNGKVLDIQGVPKVNARIITCDKRGSPSQQWFVNSNHSIVSAVDNLAINVEDDRFVSGNFLVAITASVGKDGQRFYVEHN